MTGEEIADRFLKGDEQFQQIHKILGSIDSKLEKIEVDAQSTREIVEAWNAVKIGGKFIRWAIPIIASIGAAWAALKGYFYR